MRLFCDRAALARPGFGLTAGNVAAVSEICRRLDGIPLAIELAAARVNALTAGQLAARLDDRFRLLAGASRSGLPRHRTLRAAIEWSHDLLSEAEQICFRRLAVFAGGCTLEAAEAVCPGGALTPDLVFQTVTSLVDRSLLTVEERLGSMRYGMLESIHQYARQKLAAAGESAGLSGRQLRWLLDFAGRADLDGPDQAAWLDLLESEFDNIRPRSGSSAATSVSGGAGWMPPWRQPGRARAGGCGRSHWTVPGSWPPCTPIMPRSAVTSGRAWPSGGSSVIARESPAAWAISVRWHISAASTRPRSRCTPKHLSWPPGRASCSRWPRR